MTKVTEPSASHLQEILADYLSKNLRHSEDKGKLHDGPDDGAAGSKRHKKHKHKSKKRKKSHHSDREDDSRHIRSGRSHHRKHRHSDRERRSGSRRQSESKVKIPDKKSEEKTRTDVDAASLLCNEQQKLKDIAIAKDPEEKVSTDIKTESTNASRDAEAREDLRSEKKMSALKAFFRDSVTDWRGKETQKLIVESKLSTNIQRAVHTSLRTSESQKGNDDAKEKIEDSAGEIRVIVHGSEKREISLAASGNGKENVAKDSKSMWRNIVPSSVRQKESKSGETANESKASALKISRFVIRRPSGEIKKLDIEKSTELKENVDSTRETDTDSEKLKALSENNDTEKVKADEIKDSCNVWHSVDLESEKRKIVLEEQKLDSKEQIVKEESKIMSEISRGKLNETISKMDATIVKITGSEPSDVKKEASDQLGKKDIKITGELVEKPISCSSESKTSTSDPPRPPTSCGVQETKILENVEDGKKEIAISRGVGQDSTDPTKLTMILPMELENILLTAHPDKKVSEELVGNLLPDLSKKNSQALPTVEVQVSTINSTTVSMTENDVQPNKNCGKSILPSSTLKVTPPGDILPQAASEPTTKPKGKIVIKDLTICQALKNAEEERLLKLSQMEEGEVEDSAVEEEEEGVVNSGGSTPQSDEGSGIISEKEESKSKKKKKRKKSKHKERCKKRKLEKGQDVSGRSHSSSKKDRKSKKVDTHDPKSKPRRDSHTGKLVSPSRRDRSRSPHHKGSTNRTRSPQRRSRSPPRRGRSRSPPPRGGRITSPLRGGSRMRDRWRSLNKQPQIFRDLREKIDKKKLLEIARKNVLQMMQDGTLPAGLNVNALKQEQIVAIKAGGKGVTELTEFCRSLVETGDDSSSDEKQVQSDEDNDMPFIHHPFKLRDLQPTIRLNIRNAVQLPTKTPAEKTADAARLRLQFPVSSGSHHRNHELEWVPVEKTEDSPSQKKSKEAAVPPKPHVELSSHPLAQFIAPGPGLSALAAPPPPPPPLPPPVPVEPANEVFPSQKSLNMDIASAMLMRVKAVQRLQENPHDMEALNQMYHAQQQMQEWAQSKLLPGQFGALGDTRMLTPEELSGPTPVWVKKEILKNAAPLRGGIGMHLLKKMGWNPGEGLGKNKEGSLEPLMLDVKTDKKGLVSTGEIPQKTILPAVKMPRDLSSKHPVSALMELCSKRKWGTPEYTLLDETGPAHRKTFLFKVRVKGVDYQPSVSSSNKKQAKALSASVCLQSMGLLPRNLNKPL